MRIAIRRYLKNTLLIFTFATFFILVNANIANASKVYQGLPKIIRHQKFRERTINSYIYMKSTDNVIKIGPETGPAFNSMSNTKYKYFRKIKTYLISPYWKGDNINYTGISHYISVQVLPKKRIYVEVGNFNSQNQHFTPINYYLLKKIHYE